MRHFITKVASLSRQEATPNVGLWEDAVLDETPYFLEALQGV